MAKNEYDDIDDLYLDLGAGKINVNNLTVTNSTETNVVVVDKVM